MRAAGPDRTPDNHVSLLGGSDAHGPESPVLVCAEGDPLPDAWKDAGDNPMGTHLVTRHLPSGVAYLRPVPDHDPEGRRRDPENGALDPVRPAAPDHRTGA